MGQTAPQRGKLPLGDAKDSLIERVSPSSKGLGIEDSQICSSYICEKYPHGVVKGAARFLTAE